MYTYKVEQAIQAASLLHQPHERKGAIPIPYITHLMAVTLSLRDYTGDENTLVAALLHDTLEDTDYTEAELREDFGDTVADLVLTVTEPVSTTEQPMSWLDIKRAYAKQIKHGPEAAVLIAAADKIHNFRSMIEDYHDDHAGFMQYFGKNLQDRLDAYQAIANSINSRLKDGIVHEFNHTFDLYKQFLLDVQAQQVL